jgi:hypothetical protein
LRTPNSQTSKPSRPSCFIDNGDAGVIVAAAAAGAAAAAAAYVVSLT